MLVGPDATRDQWAVHALAHHLGAPVANTWGAKGIYPWDDAHHMGTCGLQRDDFTLLGFDGFDLVIAFGIDDAEAPPERFALAPTLTLGVDRATLRAVEAIAPARDYAPGPNDLYTRIAAIAQPGYVDDSSPVTPRGRHGPQAVTRPRTRVTAQPGLAGLWIARTFPTDRMGSVIVPAHDRPGIGAAVGLVSAIRAPRPSVSCPARSTP